MDVILDNLYVGGFFLKGSNMDIALLLVVKKTKVSLLHLLLSFYCQYFSKKMLTTSNSFCLKRVFSLCNNGHKCLAFVDAETRQNTAFITFETFYFISISIITSTLF